MNLIWEISESAEIGYAWFMPFVAILCWVPRIKDRLGYAMQAMNLWLAILGAIGLVLIGVGIASEVAAGQMGLYSTVNRYFGPFGMSVWLRLILTMAVPQVFWMRRVRRLPAASLAVCGGVWLADIAYWLQAANREYLPSNLFMMKGFSVAGIVVYVAMVAGLALFLWRRQEVADLRGV